jgi:hypothetical protein
VIEFISSSKNLGNRLTTFMIYLISEALLSLNKVWKLFLPALAISLKEVSLAAYEFLISQIVSKIFLYIGYL